ncbi:MAG: lipoprotein insertase outer membrane protein LolB [Stenotrophobium sp.]
MIPRYWLIAALLALLSGCATLPHPLPGTGNGGAALWPAQRDQLQRITHFELQARIASGGVMGITKGDLHWQQNADGSFALRVSGPFGVGAASISGNAQLVEVRTRDGVFPTTDPQQWLQQRMGWTLPVAGLRWWVLGLPAPDSAAQLSYNPDGTLATLQQDGWQLDYTEYLAADGYTLPRKLQLSGKDATLKVVIDQWQNLPPRQ